MDESGTQGLTAAQAAKRVEEGKSNTMPKSGESGAPAILARNLFTLFNLLNAVLAALLILVGSYRNLLFMGVVFSNLIIGTVQELRAKRTHDRLRLLSEGKVKTVRDGAQRLLSPGELVKDDVVRLGRGDQVPADAVVLCGEAQVDESILTGESLPVDKRAGSPLLSGSFLVSGRLEARLTAVGAQSYMGKLQMAARKVKRPQSILMRDMKKIIRLVSVAVLPLGLLLYMKQRFQLDLSQTDAVVRTVASVIGMIPEGLMLLVSVSLAAGVITLGRSGALVNELYGIESLARVDVVCMDKTGTLTGGEMTFHSRVPLRGAEDRQIDECLSALLGAMDAENPTLAALRAACPPVAREALETVPFSSERKWSLARFSALGYVALGAPERLLNGQELCLAQSLAAQGLRVVALAQSDGEAALASAAAAPALPPALRPLALLCVSDALRPRVCETVRYFGKQGVTLKVLSGDSPLTVSRVASDAGVPNAESWVDLSAREEHRDYAALSRAYTVFGRVSPEDKRGLIRAMQADGRSVAMVGDGVNDIPALKSADCSIAMAGGSDAASRVAQMTLLSGGFDAMPQIVWEGRRVINNITRAASLFLVKNIFSMLLSLLLLALPFAYPFAPIQFTLISTLAIGAPSFVLALQPSRERVRGDFIRNIVSRALPGGICATLMTVAVMLFKQPLGYTDATVSTLCTLLAGYSGLVVLLLCCLPLNPLRAAVVVLMSVAMYLAVTCFPRVFYLVPVEGSMRWVLLGLGLLVPFVQLGLYRLLAPMRRSEKGLDAAD